MSCLKTFSFVSLMINKTKIIIAFLSWLPFIISCDDKSHGSAFDELLKTPPYAALTDSIQDDRGNHELYFRRAVLLNQNDLLEPALEDFKKAWSLKQEERYALGISTILLEKKPDSAITYLHTALQQLPNSFLLKLRLARAYDQKNQVDDALLISNELLQTNPEQVDVLKMKAGLLDKKGNIQEAIATLEKAYALAPFDIELNHVLALKYAENKNRRVLKLCDSLIKKDPLGLHGEPYYYKGIYYANVNEKANALEQFNQAISHDYYLLDAYIEKGAIFYEQKKYDDALKAFLLANNISATFPDAYYWMGKCQEALGQKTEAKRNYERAYGLDKSFLNAKEAADRINN
jgi:tetratricopeptide (TPR) repeat protein